MEILQSIDRKVLDFDFEKLCSVSLSRTNVYACLVCGKYFQGRGKSTHAYTHSLKESHHIFLNLETSKFYQLPDNFEIQDPSLDDISHLLSPKFSKDDIATIDQQDEPVKAFDGKLYYPGIVGLNNLQYNDYCNVVFHALSHIIPLRNHFLKYQSQIKQISDDRYLLQHRFGEVIRKLWNPRNFKAHVSPHEMLQAIIISSNKKFGFTAQGDAIVFLSWFLNSLLGSKREKCSIIKQTLEGKLRIHSRRVLPQDLDEPNNQVVDGFLDEKVDNTSFLYLTLNLPPMPLYPEKDNEGKIIRPRVNIYELLSKYNNSNEFDKRTPNEAFKQRYEIMKLPQYLILYIKRFSNNNFFIEKKTHIVDFPLVNLDMTSFLSDESKQKQTINAPITYNLIANIVHDGKPEPGKGTYRIHLIHKRTNKWFELQDLYVTEMEDLSLIKFSECYIQIWEINNFKQEV